MFQSSIFNSLAKVIALQCNVFVTLLVLFRKILSTTSELTTTGSWSGSLRTRLDSLDLWIKQWRLRNFSESICAGKRYIREEIKRAGMASPLFSFIGSSCQKFLAPHKYFSSNTNNAASWSCATYSSDEFATCFFGKKLFKLSEAGRASSTIKEGRQSLSENCMMALLQSVHYSA